jgi:dolichyl-phosphate beta-glucosyltransferase
MISLILPAYNPGLAVEQTWFAVREFLAARASRGDAWEAVFVLDGCTDGTHDRLARLPTASDQRMRVVSYAPNRGKGHAVRTGLLAARGEYRIFTDIDLAYSFDDIMRLSDALRGGAAVAIASREHFESRVLLPAGVLGHVYRRYIQSRVFGAIVRMLLPLEQRDTQAGLKGMTAAVADRLVPELQCNGFGFDCELLTACARSGIAVTETPVSVRYENTTSTTGARAALRMIGELWKIRRAWRRKSVPLPAPMAIPAPVPKAA